MMGVRILEGKADGPDGQDAAALYCSTTGVMVGFIFEGHDAGEQAAAFCTWLSEYRWFRVREEVFGPDHVHHVNGDPLANEPDNLALVGAHAKHLTASASIGGDGRDPREWDEAGLEKLQAYWHRTYVGEDGFMLDPLDCACGHHHMQDDADEDGGCVSICGCIEWRPGNRAAELRAEEGGEILV